MRKTFQSLSHTSQISKGILLTQRVGIGRGFLHGIAKDRVVPSSATECHRRVDPELILSAPEKASMSRRPPRRSG